LNVAELVLKPPANLQNIFRLASVEMIVNGSPIMVTAGSSTSILIST
jgi:hypothetical protein